MSDLLDFTKDVTLDVSDLEDVSKTVVREIRLVDAVYPTNMIVAPP